MDKGYRGHARIAGSWADSRRFDAPSPASPVARARDAARPGRPSRALTRNIRPGDRRRARRRRGRPPASRGPGNDAGRGSDNPPESPAMPQAPR
ncbi:MAG: hypothetical protein ACK56I_20980, partial [bacterium]